MNTIFKTTRPDGQPDKITRPRPWLTVLAVIGGMVGWGVIFGVCYLIYIWRA